MKTLIKQFATKLLCTKINVNEKILILLELHRLQNMQKIYNGKPILRMHNMHVKYA